MTWNFETEVLQQFGTAWKVLNVFSSKSLHPTLLYSVYVHCAMYFAMQNTVFFFLTRFSKNKNYQIPFPVGYSTYSGTERFYDFWKRALCCPSNHNDLKKEDFFENLNIFLLLQRTITKNKNSKLKFVKYFVLVSKHGRNSFLRTENNSIFF